MIHFLIALVDICTAAETSSFIGKTIDQSRALGLEVRSASEKSTPNVGEVSWSIYFGTEKGRKLLLLAKNSRKEASVVKDQIEIQLKPGQRLSFNDCMTDICCKGGDVIIYDEKKYEKTQMAWKINGAKAKLDLLKNALSCEDLGADPQ